MNSSDYSHHYDIALGERISNVLVLMPILLVGIPGNALVLMVVVRPAAVSVATVGLPLDWRQRLFLGWLAPRGIVTAAVASLFAIRLEQAGVLGAGRLQGLVFLTILMTVGLQGLTAQPLAKVLGLIDQTPEASDGAPLPAEPSEAAP